jgi:hypothetical protein
MGIPALLPLIGFCNPIDIIIMINIIFMAAGCVGGVDFS